jgi:hypothetical protein
MIVDPYRQHGKFREPAAHRFEHNLSGCTLLAAALDVRCLSIWEKTIQWSVASASGSSASLVFKI